MLASFIDGRVRLRHPALKNPASLALLERSALALEGVTEARGNPCTGSLLLTYNPAVLSREKLLRSAKQLQAFLPAPAPKRRSTQARRRLETALLSGAMLATIAGTVLGKTAHLTAGSFLVAACARHLYLRRNHL